VKILDTDTCIEILRGNQTVIDRRAAINDEVATTWITAAELYFGAAGSKAPERNRELVTAFLDSMDVISLNKVSAQIFGEAKALLRRQGMGLADADLFIGAIAASLGATVVTGNQRHYERIPGVTLENWIR
jgi:tRNA(fMet)-specific endonuclease VapC